MRSNLLAALFLIVAVNQPVLARQEPTLVSQAETTADQQDPYRPNMEQNPKPRLRQRVGFSKRHERLLNRDPKEIIPDICTGC